MPRIRTLLIVLAGGAGGRLELLTQERAKPAVSFAGTHRLIDFALSNAHNSAFDDVWVSQQFNAMSLQDHLANGRPWDLDRTGGGLLLLHPRQGHDERGGFQKGTADGLWRFAPVIREWGPEALVVVSADAVYTLDYGALVEEHVAQGADVTMVTTEVDPDDASRYGVVQVEGDRVTDYRYKPEEPAGHLVSNEIFVFRPERVLDLLDELAEAQGEEGLADLGTALLPRLVQEGDVREHRMHSYWRDVGTLPAYFDAHQELLGPEPPLDLDSPAWPILTKSALHRMAAHVSRGAVVEDSLLAPASRVAGRIERSVVGRAALIEEGAEVRDALILPGAVVRAGAHVTRAIVDEGVEVGRGARVGEADGELALLGLRTRVGADAEVPAGARVPEPQE